jgi:hypothetical protein
LFAYFQYQLSLRGVYTGAVNGIPTPNFSAAIKQYKAGMGLTPDSNLNPDFMLAYLSVDHDAVAAKIDKMNKSHISRIPINLKISQFGIHKPAYSRKEKVKLELSVNVPAYVYCFLFDSNNKATRIYPNQFSSNSFLDGDKPLLIPDSSRYSLIANSQGKDEKIACYGSHKDVYSSMPESMRGPDLVPLSKTVSSEKMRLEFAKLGGEGLGWADFVIKTDPK